MQNSAQQAPNATSPAGRRRRAVREGPVLLVDDLVDSRWTLTVAGALLRDPAPGRCSRSRWPSRRPEASEALDRLAPGI